MNNRLQFRHHTPIFDSREEAIDYIYQNIKNAREGLAYEDDSYGYSLFAEPTILRYKNEADDELPSGSTPNPHLILAIGSNTNEGRFHSDNRFCIIDIDKTEKEIEDLWEYVEEVAKGLNIITRDTNTLKLYSEKTDEGNVVSGDVVVAESQIFDDIRRANTLLNTEDGLFTFVKLEYEPGDDKFTFFVNGDKKIVPLCDYYIIKGYYSKKDESLHLIRKDGVDIKVSLENLIDEWGVEGEATNTPIVLTKEEVGYGDDALHNHVEPYQDLLKADVRLSDRKYNILKKTSDGRYLYVDGLASNIVYFKDGEEISVQDALRQATKGISNDSTNIIYEKADGCYATAQLRYINKENKLIFTTSNVTGGTSVEEIKLNAVEAFTKIYYDSVTETLVIMYKDGSGDIQEVDVPIGQMMQDWEWDIQNEGHNVKLHKQRVVAGNDKVSADAAIYNDPDNILVDKNHELFVKGTADNIRYGRDGNVSDELDNLNDISASLNNKIVETSGKVDTLRVEFDAEVERSIGEDERLSEKLNNEIERSKEKDREIENNVTILDQKIGTGFTTDGHETVTYKFNELSAKTDTIGAKTDANTANIGLLSAKTESEISRANSEEQRIEKKFDDEIGEGFSIRNTVRDEINREKDAREAGDNNLQGQIDVLEDKIDVRLREVVNYDHSINVDKEEVGKSVVKVNISEESIVGLDNIIKLNNDGLYAGVDLDYYFDSGTSKNVLVFKTTNGTKTFDLKTNSVVDKIYYDPTREAIIIEYTVDGHRMPDVVVPVGDLIDEWRVSENTSGAIRLNKFRDSSVRQDILSAETIIASHEDNILINDAGALYVSGAQIEQNKADIAALGERINEAEADIDALEGGLAAEIARATGEETRIEEKLDREIERSVGQDDEIWAALRAEINRSTNKDNEHDREIAEEIQRAKDAEHALHDEILAESTARLSADTALDAKLSQEIARSTDKDNEHDSLISGLRTDLDSEVARSVDEDNAIRTALSAETNARISSDTELNTKIDNEITRSTEKDVSHDSAIANLRTDLSNETTNRANADNELRDLINEEVDRARTSESAITIALNAETTARQSGDTALSNRIDTETINRQNADNALNTRITNEISRATDEERRIENKLDQEITRSTNKDADLQTQISNEVTRAISAESTIRETLTTEISQRQVEDASLQTQISNEVTRAQGAENALDIKIENEKETRANEDAKIWAKIRPIEFFDTTTVHNERVRNSGETPDEVRHSVIIANADKNIVKATDNLGGVYATARLAYDEPTNTITLFGTDDILLSQFQLGPGGILDNIYYDHTEKDLVIEYTTANGEHKIEKFPVAQLFNEWDIQNPSEGSALELHKVNQTTETGTVDILWGRVLLTGAVERPDGTIDYGDNIIRIVNNGLYASGAEMAEALRISECTKSELKYVEEAIFQETVGDIYPCGSGFTYQAPPSCFIVSAKSMYDADLILDKYLCSAYTRITKIEEDVDCLTNELDIAETNVLGIDIPPCGLNPDETPFRYPAHEDACFINAATSMDNADLILDTELCKARADIDCLSGETNAVERVLGVDGNCDNLINYPATSGCLLSTATTYANADAILEEAVCKLMSASLVGSERPTTSTKIEVNPENEDERIITVDLRLSHGSSNLQTDEELTITDSRGDCEELLDGTCLRYEFTDTNALRIVDMSGSVPQSPYNGLYLSNVWDCGLYTLNGEGTPGTKYRTDESESARDNYNKKYRNGVRY